MAQRALIIAVENYPQMQGGLEQTLPGTLAAAKEFEQWLHAKWEAEQVAAADRQVWFCSEPRTTLGRGPWVSERAAALDDITECLDELRTAGQNATDALYVYFSGHGFTFTAGASGRTDYVLTSDYRSLLTAHCCLNFDGLVAWLRDHLGPGVHYYFVDACRNVVTPTQLVPGPFPLGSDPQSAGEPSTFVLQSTFQGATASAGAAFPTALLGGLRGVGKAKRYRDGVDDAMVVHYGSLREYLAQSLRGQRASSRTTGDVSEADAVLATIRPIPMVQCTVSVDQAAPDDSGVVFLRRGRGAVEQHPLQGPSQVFMLEPDRYAVGVAIRDGVVEPDTMVEVDVFEPTPVRFSKTATVALGGALGMVPSEPPDPRALESSLRSVSAAPAWKVSDVHETIAARFPHNDEGVFFSESLGGAVTDTDLDVWLAILGGGRILPRQPGQYSKIAPQPLYDFGQERPGGSPVYVLSGLSGDRPLEASISRDATPHWRDVAPVADLPCVAHAYVPTEPGPLLVSFRLAARPPLTVASLAVPNRATLMTVTLDDEDELRVSQYLLPIGHLIGELPAHVRTLVEQRQSPLDDVRSLAVASRAFRRRGDLERELPTAALLDLLYAKWVDPIGACFVAYQALRRGVKHEVEVAARNLVANFPFLPDGAALSRLAGLPADRPAGVPLFLDGLRAYPDHAGWLPLPAGLMDFARPWTAWKGAV